MRTEDVPAILKRPEVTYKIADFQNNCRFRQIESVDILPHGRGIDLAYKEGVPPRSDNGVG